MEKLIRVSDDEKIFNFFSNLSREKRVIIVKVRKNYETLNGELLFSLRTGNDPLIKLYDNKMYINDIIKISLYYQDALYFFQTEVISSFGDEYNINYPKSIDILIRRKTFRYKVEDNQSFFILDSFQNKSILNDISIAGLSFHSKKKLYKKGDILRNLELNLFPNEKIYLDCEIKYIYKSQDKYINGVIFIDTKRENYKKLFQHIFLKVHKDLDLVNNYSKEEILKIIKEDSYSKFNRGEIEKYLYKIDKLKINSNLYSSYIFCRDNIPVSLASIFHIYKKTFWGEDFYSIEKLEFNIESSRKIYKGLVDFMLYVTDFNYYITYIKQDQLLKYDLFLNINEVINNPEKCIYEKINIFKCSTEKVLESDYLIPEEYSCELIEKPDIFIEFAKENLEELVVNAYAYNIEDFYLECNKEMYNGVYVKNTRRLFVIKKNEEVLAYAIAEVFSDNVFIGNKNDNIYLYIAAKEVKLKNIISILLEKAVFIYKELERSSFNLKLRFEKSEVENIDLFGINYYAEMGRAIFDREGLIEFKNLLGDNFIYHSKYYPLTESQKAIWNIERMYPNTNFSTIPTSSNIKEKINVFFLKIAIDSIIRENDAIRTKVILTENGPKQYIEKYKSEEIDVFHLDDKKDGVLEEWLEDISNRPFKLLDSKLYYFAIFTLGDNEGGFILKAHHLVSDGWSVVLLLKKIAQYYDRLRTGEKIFSNKSPSYIEYILNEKKYLSSNLCNKHKMFWEEKYTSNPEFKGFDKKIVKDNSLQAKRKTFTMNKSMTKKINDFCICNNNSPFIFFMLILYTYIYKKTNMKDIVLGTPVINRANKREKEIIGMFINVLPIRFCLAEDKSFLENIENLFSDWRKYLKNQKYSYNLILEDYRKKNKKSDKLFDICISFQNAKFEDEENSKKYIMKWNFNKSQTESLIIHINDRDNEDIYKLDFDFLNDLYNENEINNMWKEFSVIIEKVLENTEIALNKINLISEKDRDYLVNVLNNTQKNIIGNITVNKRFGNIADKYPNNIAVEYKEESITYKELNKKSSQLALLLKREGIIKESFIGILCEKSIEMIIGIFAVLKTGGVFVPIDPEFPDERISYLLNDSKPTVVLTKNKYKNRINDFFNIINLEDDNIILEEIKELNPINDINSLAYMIYTSGSTGNPKGVMIEHKSLVNYIESIYYRFDKDIKPTDKCFSVASMSFDASIVEIFLPLMYGATLSIYDEPKIMDLKKMCKRIIEKEITFTFLPPTILTDVCNELKKSNSNGILNKMLVGVESIKHDTLLEFMNINPEMKILVGYGPTETTICSTFYRFEPNNKLNDIVPIGKPIFNTKIYLLDENKNLVPFGETGEIYIGGSGLARGYFGNDKLTNEKFIQSPFDKNDRIYSTGDKGRWLKDGNLFFNGRKDRQLKIRGYRIEPEEIETVLIKHKNITKVVIVNKIIKNRKYLCAYYTANIKLTTSELRGLLNKKLPEHMIPTYFIQLDTMPKTSNGKLDTDNLSISDETIMPDRECQKAKTGNELILKKIWGMVLGEKDISINDNFFELGGDSIGAIQVCAKLFEEGYKIETKDIYENPEISKLSLILNKVEQVEEGIITGEIKLTPIQKWFFTNKSLNHNYFNQSIMLYRKKGFDENIIRNVFRSIIEHHDALRIYFIKENEEIKQFNRDVDASVFKLETIDIMSSENKRKIIEDYSFKANSSHNIEKGDLIKLVIFKTEDGDHLLITINHLIIDGVSWRIILDDFQKGYYSYLSNNEFVLKGKTTSFKKWSDFLNSNECIDNIYKDKKYWEKTENTKVCALPKDFKSVKKEMRYSDNITFKLDSEYTEDLLKNVNHAYNTNIDEILLSALGITILEWTYEKNVLISMESHGRHEISEDIDVSNTVGWFTSSYPVILSSIGERDLGEYIKEVKENIRTIPKKGIGYQVLKYLNDSDERKISSNLVPEIGFNYLGNLDYNFKNNLFERSEYYPGPMVCPNSERLFAIDINGEIRNHELQFYINYNTHEYKKESIDNIFNNYIKNIKDIILYCKNKEEKELTGSDLGIIGLSQDDFDEINNLITTI